MITRSLVVILGFAISFVAHACDDWRKAQNALRTLETSDPVASAQQAAKGEDFRFVSVQGYSEFVPAIKNQRCALETRRPRLIDPTSDVICNEEHGRLKQFAYRYAERYNQQVQKLLKVAGKRSCES